MNETTLFDPPGTAIAEHTAAPLAVVEATPLAVIQRIAERGGDPNAWMQLLREWEDRIAAEQFGHALAKFQSKCPQIQKTREIKLRNGTILFASFDDVMAVIKPLLAECELSVMFTACMTTAGTMKSTCIVRHGRHTEESEVELPSPKDMSVNDTQKMGAALSYAKRYALCGALNIVVSDEDRDGDGLAETISDEQCATLREWMQASGANEAAYLKFLGVATLADIPQRDYVKALQALKDKAAKR
jgi:hypothetical protein